MTEKVTGLSPRQRRAIEALLQGSSITEAAEKANVSRKTLYVWLGQSDFREELDRLGGAFLEEVANRMVGLASEAVETLRKILTAKDVPIANQIQAVNVILKRSSELWELHNLNKRIEVLEAVLQNSESE